MTWRFGLVGQNFVGLCLGFALGMASLFGMPAAWAGGVTVITHGFNGNVTDWIIPMAETFEGHPSFRGSSIACYAIEVRSAPEGGLKTEAKWLGGVRPKASDSGEIVIKLDWSTQAGLLGASSTQVAQAAAAAIRHKDLVPDLEGRPLAESPLHLIGHSRGGSVVSEIARLLGEEGLWVDQVTTLDPVPVAAFSDAAVTTWENVLYADNYYQQIGGFLVPTGSPIFGAFNRKLLDLGGGYGSPHSDAHLWYHGTIELSTPSTDTQATIMEAQRDAWWTAAETKGNTSGFLFSRLGQGDRMSSFQPGGDGTEPIHAGYHRGWDLGPDLDPSTNRTPLSTKRDQWPNLIQASLGTSTVEAGGQLTLSTHYQTDTGAGESPELHVFFDRDRNPWNANELPLQEAALEPSGREDVFHQSASIPIPDVPNTPCSFASAIPIASVIST